MKVITLLDLIKNNKSIIDDLESAAKRLNRHNSFGTFEVVMRNIEQFKYYHLAITKFDIFNLNVNHFNDLLITGTARETLLRRWVNDSESLKDLLNSLLEASGSNGRCKIEVLAKPDGNELVLVGDYVWGALVPEVLKLCGVSEPEIKAAVTYA